MVDDDFDSLPQTITYLASSRTDALPVQKRNDLILEATTLLSVSSICRQLLSTLGGTSPYGDNHGGWHIEMTSCCFQDMWILVKYGDDWSLMFSFFSCVVHCVALVMNAILTIAKI